MSTGTPKTLVGAVKNGATLEDDRARSVALHVRDFLSQRFTVAMLKAQGQTLVTLNALFMDIVGDLTPRLAASTDPDFHL